MDEEAGSRNQMFVNIDSTSLDRLDLGTAEQRNDSDSDRSDLKYYMAAPQIENLDATINQSPRLKDIDPKVNQSIEKPVISSQEFYTDFSQSEGRQASVEESGTRPVTGVAPNIEQ